MTASRRARAAAVAMVAALLGGCGTNAGTGEQVVASGGTPGSGGAAASTGGRSTGGTPTIESGGSSSAGAGGRDEDTGAGGSTGGSLADGSDRPIGTGGAITGQDGGGTSLVEPSAGCGKQGRPAGGRVTVSNDHVFTFPESYDGKNPLPVFMGFHACGNPIDQFLNLTKGSRFETDYVRAVGRSSDGGGCWNYGADVGRATRVYDELRANHCIDEARVFAAGHSSGAQMIVQILTHGDVASRFRFKAVAPVAASDYGALSVPVPVLYIHGKKDTVRGNDGAATVARFRAVNDCDATSTVYAPVMGCASSGTTVHPGCVSYQGCTEPTIWCSHDDPQYGGTSHGVPCFAVPAMYDFFAAVR